MGRRRPAAKPPPGIEVRHRAQCDARTGGECSCEPSYRAWLSVPGQRRKLQKTFPTLAAATNWRRDAQVALSHGALGATRRVRLREAAASWLEGARAGLVRNRSGDVYKPSTIRSYEQALDDYVLPTLGNLRLDELRRPDVQRFVDTLITKRLSASTVRNAVMPLRAICRRALVRGELIVNPTTGLELPASRGRRDRFASAAEARELIAAAPERDRAIWATAFYAGLRRGELRALRVRDIDLRRGVISVERNWDRVEGALEPKSSAGVRRVPIPDELRQHLQRLEGRPDDLVFGRTTDAAFDPSTVSDRAQRAWKAAGLAPITLHECRHTYASLMIASGVNPKTLQVFMGHASITITLDRYGHLMPGSEDEAVGLLNGYLERHRLAVIGTP